MSWWIVFIVLNALLVAATFKFVPAVNRQNYFRCNKDRMYWLATSLMNAIWVIAAIQSIVAPGNCPIWLRVIGVVLFIVGSALRVWAWRVNNLFVPIIIYVPPRLRVTDGPYRFCAHPGYLGFVWSALGAFFMLGQVWAFFPTLAYVLLICHRILVEDRILSSKVSL